MPGRWHAKQKNMRQPCSNVPHDFFEVKVAPRDTFLGYTTIVCAYCGQVRELQPTGDVHIVLEVGDVKKHYDTSKPETNETTGG